jgi:hypothetical protein
MSHPPLQSGLWALSEYGSSEALQELGYIGVWHYVQMRMWVHVGVRVYVHVCVCACVCMCMCMCMCVHVHVHAHVHVCACACVCVCMCVCVHVRVCVFKPPPLSPFFPFSSSASDLFLAAVSVLAAGGFLLYGGRLFLMLQRFPIESRGRRKKLREVGLVTTICAGCFSLRYARQAV